MNSNKKLFNEQDSWVMKAAATVLKSGRTAIPTRGGYPTVTFKHGEHYLIEDEVWRNADGVSIRLDNEILIDHDGHKKEDAFPVSELAKHLGLSEAEFREAIVQTNAEGDSLHFLFDRSGYEFENEMFHSQDGYFTGVDVKTGNQLMHLKPHKTLTLPEQTKKAPATLCEVLERSRTAIADPSSHEKALEQRMAELRSGENLHDNTMRLAARYGSMGLKERDIIAILNGMLEHLPYDKRVGERINDIPRLVRSGIEKYGPDPAHDDNGQHKLTLYRPPIPEVPDTDDMLIEGLICAKVSFLGAYAGAGKTTAMVPLIAVVAGLMEVEGMEIEGWRRVVYISEHPEQFEQSLKALSKAHNIMDEVIADRVKVVLAHRMSAEAICEAVPEFQKLAVEHTDNDVTVQFMPWIIIDTQAATLALESENDTAEASAAMAILKIHFDTVPLTIIAHTAKAHKHGDAESMTIRGAGSFEADSNQVMLLSYDKDTQQRFIEISIPKHRFNASADALAVSFQTTKLKMKNRFGRTIDKEVGYCSLEPVTSAQKTALKQELKEERKVLDNQRRLDRLLPAIRSVLDDAEDKKEIVTKTWLKTKLKSKRIEGLKNNQQLGDLLDDLYADGTLRIEDLSETQIEQMREDGWAFKPNQRAMVIADRDCLDPVNRMGFALFGAEELVPNENGDSASIIGAESL